MAICRLFIYPKTKVLPFYRLCAYMTPLTLNLKSRYAVTLVLHAVT